MQASILESLETEKAADIVEEMSPHEAADVLAELEEATSQGILEEMENEPKSEVSDLLEFEEDSAGGMMNTEYIALPENAPVADALLALSRKVDLLVIGSRRWGPMARVLLGGTGETLLHEAHCPMLVVPRPRPPGRGSR